MEQRIRGHRLIALAAGSALALAAGAVRAQDTAAPPPPPGDAAAPGSGGTIDAQTDQPGGRGPAGPAGQAGDAAPAVPTAQAGAQGTAPGGTAGIGEIVVTAEHRTSSVQKTAASISVRTGDELRKEGKTQLSAILENVPGIVGGAAAATGTTAGGGTDALGAGITIRGIQSNLGAGGSAVSTATATAYYADDIYEGIGGNYDVDRAEVLRGPQGTLYGRSATAGVVSVHTRDPDLNRVTGLGLAEMGSYALRHLTAAVNVPVIDDMVAVRVAGDYYHRDGFNTYDGAGRIDTKNARIKLLARPTDRLTILLAGAVQYNEDASGGLSPYYDANKNLYYVSNPTSTGKNNFKQVWANIQYDFGFATLTYIPAYRTWKQDATIVGAGPGFTVNQTLRTPKDHFLTNEARLTSNSASRFKWQVGALDYDNRLANTNTIRLALPGDPLAFSADIRKHTHQTGVFAEVGYPITDRLRVTGGLRYDHTRVTVAEDYTSFTLQTLSLPADQGRSSFDNVTYKGRVEYDLTPRNLVYVSYSTAFSPGDVTVSTDTVGQPFKLTLTDETLKSLEIGTKNRFLDNRLQVNADVFRYWYGGYQNAGIDINPGPDLAFTTLVAPLRSFGGEFEAVYQPTPRDRIGLTLAYVKGRFVKRSDEFQTYIARRDVAQVPPFAAYLSYSHRFDLPGGSSILFTGDGRYLSRHDGGTITQQALGLGGLPLIRVPGAAIGNLSLSWTSPDQKLTVGGYVRNISNNRYVTNSQVDTSQGFVASSALAIYDPRTFGGVVTVNF